MPIAAKFRKYRQVTRALKIFTSCTDKKENEIFVIYQEIQIGSVAKSYMRKGFLIYEEMRKYMRRPFVIYDFAPDPASKFPDI